MAKKRKTTNLWKGEQRDENVTSLFAGMVSEAQKSLGGDASLGFGNSSVGLRLPALSTRYLFQSTTFPLSRMIQITGEEGSAKSAFLYEIFRWHSIYGGGNVLAENENKDSPELRNSILAWNPTWINRVVVVPTFTLEEWQDVVTKYVDVAIAQQDAAGGPGRTVPICFGVDSIMATAPQEEVDAVRSEGHASRGYALAANLISRYMRTMPERVKNYPFTVAGTNHLKPTVDKRGFKSNNIPGGKSVKFMETYEIEMKKTQGADIDKLEYGGLRIQFIARKNSLGPSRKSITAELLWWYAEDDNGNFRQYTAWDWDTATIELFASLETAKGKKTLFNRIREITGIRVVSKSQRKAYSDLLGIPKDDPQHYRDVGAALESRPEVLNEVYKVLGIHPRFEFQPGRDYVEMKEKAEAGERDQARHLYATARELPVTPNMATEGDFVPDVDEEGGEQDG